ncbi:MAG: PD-(D/E)XK nuclease family protein [bacterium]|nr:PD-(D/E)XK nuclease family protein [bacterium]
MKNNKAKNDKYSAVWVSHSSMGDFLKCHRAYYLKNIYKDPKTKRKIGIVSPALSLGSAVHEVVEGLGEFKAEERPFVPVFDKFEKAWEKFSGKKGGFSDEKEESEMKERGVKMIKRVKDNLAPLLLKIIKVEGGNNGMPPNYLLSPEDNIILCGKIDWLQYIPEDDSIHIIDFKTGVNEESEESLQLPIYQLLLNNLLKKKRKVSGASYWYLDKDDAPKSVDLPTVEESFDRVIKVARDVKVIREKGEFLCPRGEKGCFACRDLEKVIKGEAEYVGEGEWQDLYFV